MYSIIRGKSFLFLVVFILISISAVSAQSSKEDAAVNHLREGLTHLMRGNYQNAIHYCDQALKILPDHTPSYIVRARAHFEMNNFQNAIDDCSQVIRLDKTNSTAFSIRGNAYRRTGNMERAVSDWEEALRYNPNMDEVKSNLELARISLQN